MSRIWCTGEAGFISRNLTEWCEARGHHEVVNNLHEKYYDYWRSNILHSTKEIHVLDLTLQKLIQSANVDVIVHAASVEYDLAVANPRLAIHTNIEGSYNVASIAKSLGIPIIYLSTVGKNTNVFYTTKYSGEQIIKHVTNNHIIIKPSIVYGQYDTHSHIAKLLNSIKGGASTFPLDIDAVRSYLYVDDLMSAFDVILDNLDSLTGDTVEVGNDAVSFGDLFEYINEELNICPDCTLLQSEDMLGDVCADSSFLKSLGWRPQYSIKEGLKKTIEHYRI